MKTQLHERLVKIRTIAGRLMREIEFVDCPSLGITLVCEGRTNSEDGLDEQLTATLDVIVQRVEASGDLLRGNKQDIEDELQAAGMVCAAVKFVLSQRAGAPFPGQVGVKFKSLPAVFSQAPVGVQVPTMASQMTRT